MSYPERHYLVESIVPSRSVNLFGGSSGSGKSRLSFQGMKEIQTSKTLFGYKCVDPIVQQYIAYDRLVESVHDTLNAMDLDLGDLPISSHVMAESIDAHHASTILKDDVNLLWIDGVECFTERLIEFHKVAEIVKIFVRLAYRANVSIIALMGMSKMKIGEKYNNSREELIGSTAWGRFADTILTVGCDEDNIGNDRVFKLMPRNSSVSTRNLTFNSKGHLVELIISADPESVKLVLKLFEARKKLTTAEVVSYVQDAGMSERTAKDALAYLMSHGKIRRISHGVYELCYLT